VEKLNPGMGAVVAGSVIGMSGFKEISDVVGISLGF